MEKYLELVPVIKRFKFLVLSFLIRMIILYISVNFDNYIYLTQKCPVSIVDFSIMSMLLIVEILFLVDNLIYYMKIDKFVLIRIEKRNYQLIIFKKIVSSVLYLTLTGVLVSIVSCQPLNYAYFLDRISLVVIALISSFVWVEYKETLGCILIYVVVIIFRMFFS